MYIYIYTYTYIHIDAGASIGEAGTAAAASVAHAATPSSPAVIHTFALEFVSTSVNIFSCPAEVVLFELPTLWYEMNTGGYEIFHVV